MRFFFFIVIIVKTKKNPGPKGVFASLDREIKEDRVLLVELFCRVLVLKEDSSKSSGFFE